MTGYQPREVAYLLEELEAHTGIAATLDARPGRWHVEHGNDRIRLTCTYTRNTSGKLKFHSTLHLDGAPREKVKDIAAYARLLADPDLKHPNRTPGRELVPLMPLAPGTELPEAVKALLRLGEGSPKFTSVDVGHAAKAHIQRHGSTRYRVPEQDADDNYVPDPQRYAVLFTKHDGDRIQVTVGPTGSGAYVTEDMAALDAEGGDILSEEHDPDQHARQDMAAVMERLLGFRLPSSTDSAGHYSAPAAHTTGAVTNSVQVRKATVFRV